MDTSFPLIKYSIVVFYMVKKIFEIQKSVLQIITHSHTHTSCKTLFKKLNSLTLPSLYTHEAVCFIRKNEFLCLDESEGQRYITRHNNLFLYLIHRLQPFEQGPYYSGIKLFNKLPKKVTSLPFDALN